MVAQFRGQLTKELGEGAEPPPRCLGSGSTPISRLRHASRRIFGGATPPNNGLKEITPDLVATCAEIPNFAANKTEMSHGVIE